MSTLIAKRKVTDVYETIIKHALQSNERNDWLTAIQTELTELQARRTWDLIPRPSGAKVLPCKMVLKLQCRSDNTIEKYKARLVVLGCLQRVGDYNQTFSPLVDFATVRLALTIASLTKSDVHHIDVTGAFLYDDLKETVYMEGPRGFENKVHPECICELSKGLYGL